jgi:hypothetical protein
LLRLGKRVEPSEHRCAELMDRGERQLHLGFDTNDPGDPETGRLPGAVVQQSRLSGPRLAADDQDRTLPAADVAQQLVEQLTLPGSTQQHRRPA